MFMISLLFSLSLTSCSRKEDKVSLKYEKTKFVNYSQDYEMPSEYINTYFVDDSEIRYVDATNFFNALKGFYMTSYFRVSSTYFSKNLSIFCYVNTGEKIFKTSVTFDRTNDKITVSDRYFFNLINMSVQTDYSRLISEKEATTTNEDALVFNLSDFGFNMYYINGKCLVPFSIMNTIFCSNDYYNIYYDGEKYFGVTYDISSYTKENQIQLKTCSLNNKAQTQELREETYNHLKFVLNYYYGLKDYKNINSIELELEPYKEGILSLDPEVNKQTYYSYFVNHLDELHTRMGAYSFYYDPTVIATQDNWDLEKTSPARKKYKEVEEELKSLSTGIYNDENTYRVSGSTLVIYLKSFVTGTTEHINSTDAYKYDTYEFVKYALDNVSGQGIENVVLDLSQNGGGNVGALFRVLGFISDDSIEYCSHDYLFNSTLSSLIDIDIDNDGNFEDLDAYSEYKWHVLSSYNTFSAANSFVAMSKSLGATIIGQKSGGGMCSVLPIILPDQTTIEISSQNAQMAVVDGEYDLIEGGIEPDILIDYDKFYDIDYINSILV